MAGTTLAMLPLAALFVFAGAQGRALALHASPRASSGDGSTRKPTPTVRPPLGGYPVAQTRYGGAMTQTTTALVRESDSARAGELLGAHIRSAFEGQAPDAVILFASAEHDYASLLDALARSAGTTTIVGSSSAGEFSHDASGVGQVSALAIRSASMRFRVGVGRKVGHDPLAAARAVAASFAGITSPPYPNRAALVMTDALAGHADALVEELTVATAAVRVTMAASRKPMCSPVSRRSRTPWSPWRCSPRSPLAWGCRTGGSRGAPACA